MQYINPIEILGLSNTTEALSIDNEIVKKSKRKLFADIDLSDNGHFDYHGLHLTKGDCEKVIDELSINDLKEFYLYLANNKNLNIFLINGSDDIFFNFKQDSIFTLPEFVKFISPYFAPKFDKALLNAFESEDIEQTKAILNTSFLISQSDINMAYKSVSNNIQNKISEIDKITQDIKNEESVYDEDDISEVVENVIEKFPSDVINLLPQYFQSQILKIARSINNLQVSIWDVFDNTQVPYDLLFHLLTLNIGGLDKPTFENNFKIVKKKNEERILQAKNAPVLLKWANVLLQLRKIITDVENKSLTSIEAFNNTISLFEISDLNSLPEFANEIRIQIGYSIRSLSISIWNIYNDIVVSIKIMNIALQINTDDEVIAKLKQDLVELQELEKKYNGVLVCYFCKKNSPEDNSSIHKTIYKESYRSFIGRRVEFSYVDVNIPRCKYCKKVHLKGNIQYKLYFFGFVALGVFIGFHTNGSHFIIGGLIGSLFGWFIGNTLHGRITGREGVKDDSESTLKKHPILSERINNGWTFTKPTA